VGIEASLLVLRADFELVTVAVNGEAGFFLEFVVGSGEGRIDFGLKGGGVHGDDEVGVEGTLDFSLHFATACEETLFEELLSFEVNGVFRDFSADDASNVSAKVCVKRSGPGRQGRVQVSNSVSNEFRGGGRGSGDERGDRGGEVGVLLGTPGVNFRVNFMDGLVEKGLSVDPGIKHGREGGSGGEVRGGREVGGLDAAEAVGASDRPVLILVRKEVEDPTSGFGYAGGEAPFREGEVVECIGGLEVGGSQLGVVKTLMDSGEEFEGEFEPGLAGEDGVRGVKG